jgi:sugar lactone lactonase YvrE
LTNVSGTSSPGSSSYELNHPYGIFVNNNFDLYVADTDNNRIQCFQSGEKNGTTVAGQGIPQNLQLNQPTNVVLDFDGYLFIADNENHRIIRSGFGKFECIIGCTGQSGAASNELNKPYAIRFDSYGNLYVADEFNHRIQKFTLVTNSCGKCNMKESKITFVADISNN